MYSQSQADGSSKERSSLGTAIDGRDDRCSCAAYLLARLRLSEAATIDLGRASSIVGEKLSLEPKLVRRDSTPFVRSSAGAGCEIVALECEGHPLALLLERSLALGLVNTVLGLSWPACAGSLTRIERGVLEGALATILDRLDLSPEVRMSGEAMSDVPRGGFALALGAGVGGNRGRAWLVGNDPLLERLWSSRRSEDSAGIPWVELAVTRVTAPQLVEAEVGDLLVFDETPAFAEGSPWPAELRWNRNSVPARWLADGALVACEGQSRGTEIGSPTCVARGRIPGSGEPNNDVEPGIDARVVAGICLTQVEATVRAPVVIPRGSTVVLRVDDTEWANGRITQLDGVLAVEITRKL